VTEENTAKSTIGRHILGLLLFPVIGLAVAAAWLSFTTQVLGVGKTGFGNAAAIVVMPVWAIGMGLLVWLPWWLFHRKKWGAMGAGRAILFGVLGGLLVSMILMGPSGFTTRGGAAVMGYAVIVILTVGGLVHNAILNRR